MKVVSEPILLTNKFHENYPLRTIVISNLLAIAMYAAGAGIIYQLGIFWMLFYLTYVLALEIRQLKNGCVHCYYYGKYCAFGKGKLSSLFFRRGEPDRFSCRKMTWIDLVPDLLVALLPLLAGIVLLLTDFNWIALGLMVFIAFLGTTGNSYVRGTLACRYCRQGEIGCPAKELFKDIK